MTVMTKNVTAPKIQSQESPRKILADDFPSLGELPILGGWGYSIKDAVIIDKNDPVVPNGPPFCALDIEHVFIGKRIYEELVLFRKHHDKHVNIKWTILKHSLELRDNKSYDLIICEVTALSDKDYKELEKEYEQSVTTDTFDVKAHLEKARSRMIRYVTEYWFEVTSIFGSTFSPHLE
jgi:hypothetical protein